jgi:hypothetical protein
MKFGQRFSIRKDLTPKEFAYGIWNPQMHQWRDVIEDYLNNFKDVGSYGAFSSCFI